MAKKRNGEPLGFEDALWKAADKLRGSMDASEYKHVVLGLIFLKYIDDSFSERRERLGADLAGLKLGDWVRRQRRLKESGLLSGEQEARLEALPWSWRVFDDRWANQFALLQRFAAREGHANVPVGHVEEGFKLGKWVVEQRHKKDQGRLSNDRLAELDQVEGWSWGIRDDTWDNCYALLLPFANREGHSRVPARYKEEDEALGSWVAMQRRAYIANKLSAERVARLEAAPGWSWDPLSDDWETGFAALQHFADLDGHAAPTKSSMIDDFDVGLWVTYQRLRQKQGKLSTDRFRRLESLPGWRWRN